MSNIRTDQESTCPGTHTVDLLGRNSCWSIRVRICRWSIRCMEPIKQCLYVCLDSSLDQTPHLKCLYCNSQPLSILCFCQSRRKTGPTGTAFDAAMDLSIYLTYLSLVKAKTGPTDCWWCSSFELWTLCRSHLNVSTDFTGLLPAALNHINAFLVYLIWKSTQIHSRIHCPTPSLLVLARALGIYDLTLKQFFPLMLGFEPINAFAVYLMWKSKLRAHPTRPEPAITILLRRAPKPRIIAIIHKNKSIYIHKKNMFKQNPNLDQKKLMRHVHHMKNIKIQPQFRRKPIDACPLVMYVERESIDMYHGHMYHVYHTDTRRVHRYKCDCQYS